MLELPRVTLCVIDTGSPTLVMQVMAGIRFGRCLLLTQWQLTSIPKAFGCFDSGCLQSGAAYTDFVLRRSPDWVETDHVLLVRWHRFVMDASLFEPTLMDTDYVGAPWHNACDGEEVRRGGFSLRSRRLLLALRDPTAVGGLHHPGDVGIGQTLRPWLEAEHGIVFSSRVQADRFAFENEPLQGHRFGFNGAFNQNLALGSQTLSSWIPELPVCMVCGHDGFKLEPVLLRARQPALALRPLDRRAVNTTKLDLRCRLLRWQSRQLFGDRVSV